MQREGRSPPQVWAVDFGPRVVGGMVVGVGGPFALAMSLSGWRRPTPRRSTGGRPSSGAGQGGLEPAGAYEHPSDHAGWARDLAGAPTEPHWHVRVNINHRSTFLIRPSDALIFR